MKRALKKSRTQRSKGVIEATKIVHRVLPSPDEKERVYTFYWDGRSVFGCTCDDCVEPECVCHFKVKGQNIFFDDEKLIFKTRDQADFPFQDARLFARMEMEDMN